MLALVHALAAGAELQRCLLRPMGTAGLKLESPMAAMGAAAAIAGATAAPNALGFVGNNNRGGLQVSHGKSMHPGKKKARADGNLGKKENADAHGAIRGEISVHPSIN